MTVVFVIDEVIWCFRCRLPLYAVMNISEKETDWNKRRNEMKLSMVILGV